MYGFRVGEFSRGVNSGIKLYTNCCELRRHRFSLSVEVKNCVMAQVDLRGAEFLTGLRADPELCFSTH